MSGQPTLLVLGATGMLGNAVLRFFCERPDYRVVGSVRSAASVQLMPRELASCLVSHIDVEDTAVLERLFEQLRPAVVINCIGIVKQLSEAKDALAAIPLNSLLPHRLARLCEKFEARLVHVSTDCVFAGRKGMYLESDVPDATDLYGRSKLLGEVDYPQAVTLRTSIIGHELRGSHGLVDWFLSQQGAVKGYRKAVFSGVPTVELARIIADFVLPRPQLQGVYHVSAEPIDKFALLRQVADEYAKDIEIVPDDAVVIDRSLDSMRFRRATGYQPPTWRELIARMHAVR